MPSASVVQLKQALKLIYFAQGTALEDEISRVHNAVLQLLPYDAQSRATIKVIITGADASQHIPEVLRRELQHMTAGQDIASDIPPSMSSQTWSSTTSISSEEFPPLPTVPKTSDVWQLSSKVFAPRPPQRPTTIHLPRPIDPVTQQKSTITAVAYQALSNRTQLRDTDWDVIPDAFLHLADNVAYDEVIIITRFIWVLGLHPCTALINEELNQLCTLGEHNHVVRMLGTLSEHSQCANFATYSNGLTLDQGFSQENFSYIYDAKRGATMLKLEEAATFGSGIQP
jgi:hypothetical protein